MFRTLIALLCAAVLTGCVTTRPNQYGWGEYEDQLYGAYKDPNKVAALTASLETLIAQLEQQKTKTPPGIYAELGTLYMQSGLNDRAIGMYAKERAAWPESKGLMDALISNLERQDAKKGENKQ